MVKKQRTPECPFLCLGPGENHTLAGLGDDVSWHGLLTPCSGQGGRHPEHLLFLVREQETLGRRGRNCAGWGECACVCTCKNVAGMQVSGPVSPGPGGAVSFCPPHPPPSATLTL